MEDYLEAIYFILKKKKAVRPKDISKRLGVKNSSVTGALHSLADNNMIIYSPHELITLTELGEKKAGRIAEKHAVLSRFFTDVLGVSQKESESVACKMEHVVTEKIQHRLELLIDYMDHCPHKTNHIYQDSESSKV
jgi:DtxR family Mn-dependent transcriptional regulator